MRKLIKVVTLAAAIAMIGSLQAFASSYKIGTVTHLMDGTAQMMKDNHTNCLHAKAGVSGLMNDEVIFYDEAAVCLQYLVEFGD